MKNGKKYNEKKIKNLIIILIIILLALLILYFSNPLVISRLKLKSINNSKLPDEMKVPEYINFVVGLNENEILPESVIKYYNNFAEKLIPKYYKKCKEMTSDEINKYFEKNKKIVETELGITEKTKFNNFISILKNIKNDELVLEKYYILDNTVINRSNNIVAYIGIKYENNEAIYFKSAISKTYQKDKCSIDFDTEVDTEKIEKGIENIEKREEEIKNTEVPYTRSMLIE